MGVTVSFKKAFITVLTFIVLINPAYASNLYLFRSDLNNNEFLVDTVEFDTPYCVDNSWYPLREAAEYLPIDVLWDADTREIIIYRDDDIGCHTMRAATRMNCNKILAFANDVKVVNGVTYCSANFLCQRIRGISFTMNGDLYFYQGDLRNASYISDAGSAVFRPYVNTAMYELYLKCPGDYKFVKEYLPGGIRYINKKDTPYYYANGYVYASVENPFCYIVGEDKTGATLASIIAHEAMHAYQFNLGIENSESIARQYEKELLRKMTSLW